MSACQHAKMLESYDILIFTVPLKLMLSFVLQVFGKRKLRFEVTEQSQKLLTFNYVNS